MNEGQFDRLLDLLEEALSLVTRIYATEPLRGPMYKPSDFKSGAESLGDHLPGISEPTPSPEAYRAALDAAAKAGPKRKRGRPRLTPEQKATRAAAMKDAEIAVFAPASFEARAEKLEERNAPQKTYTCTHCGRILPASVKEFHEPNCATAAAGYASHEAAPGKR